MIRPRASKNRDLPDNLHRKTDRRSGKVYYSYRDPRDGTDHGMGSDKDAAIHDAKALNAVIYSSIRSAKIAGLAAACDDVTLNQLMMRHLALCEKRALALNTIKTRKTQASALLKALGADTLIGTLAVKDFVKVIQSYEDAGKERTALGIRTSAVEMWKDAIAEGWATDNVPAKTRQPRVSVKRSRLSEKDFKAIHAEALKCGDKWIARAMELALVTTQRREDVAAMEFRSTQESTAWFDGEGMHVIQQKTGNKVLIDENVSLLGFRLGDVVKACRDNIVSRWLVHHQKRRTKSNPGDQVWVDTITRRFAAMRDKAGVTGEPGKEPPSFHEIRSLSIRLYTELRGPDFAQAIAGHKDAKTTEIYRDTRGGEWVKVG